MQGSSDLRLEKSKKDGNDSQMDSLLMNSIRTHADDMHSHLLAWCSMKGNQATILDLETKQHYTRFDAVQCMRKDAHNSTWTHRKAIPNSRMLVSLNHCWTASANLAIFNISQNGDVRKVYSFEEVMGVTGYGDVAYNLRRSILGALCVGKKTAYHLFMINDNFSAIDDAVAAKFCLKSKWRAQYNNNAQNVVTGLDFHPDGEMIATIDRYGMCLISEVNTSKCNFHMNMNINGEADPLGLCRWTSNVGECFLFIKHDSNQLNILDVEKQTLTLKTSLKLENSRTFSIDVSQINGNLLATGGGDKNIKIYDKRASRVVKTFATVHTGLISCVRWNPVGDILASSAWDKSVKLWDFKTGKVLHSEITSNASKYW